ncbi:flagellar export chaperone FliS [Anaerosporobacter sp.]|uniref:flagellar export chaperone FliS n=1 Tax=Anaerosporobacter sp. TaxID=1872529 RepID=UPI00286F56FD|nr:flagellar protein FliS [Anaerosporobacter sp.]
MNNEDLKAFTTRVTQANGSELVVIVYEIIMNDIESAKEALVAQDYTKFTRDVNHAVKFVNELINTLDFQYAISYDLMQLYLYCNKRLLQATLKNEVEPLEDTKKVLEHLLEGFVGVAKQDQSAPVMSNTQQVYAGLTYGKGSLNEMYVDPNQMSRGFRA